MIFAHGSGGGGQAVPIGAEVCIYFAGGLKRFISSLQDSLYSTTTCYYYTVITGLVCLIHTICHTLSENLKKMNSDLARRTFMNVVI